MAGSLSKVGTWRFLSIQVRIKTDDKELGHVMGGSQFLRGNVFYIYNKEPTDLRKYHCAPLKSHYVVEREWVGHFPPV
ncbi:hypothetical protein FRX31_029326 [Thalictrum thalictroides]|uniref:Uncharacterized protein n=1 Tax=Thalictrum thalictroides TaxID=46969 RepID=A0A7J6V9M6_THATH|nr:hypothetical protein FRX31_029326 [Thalictrum thalictroides]